MERLIAEVQKALTDVGVGGRIIRWSYVPGGHSGVTLAVDLEPGGSRLVVKAAQTGQKPVGRNDVLRQARILRALEPTGLRCPRVLAVGTGDRPFFVMTYLDGDATEPVLDEDGSPQPASVVDRRARAAVGQLVALHAIDLDGVGLSDEPVHSVGVELARWARTMAAVDPQLCRGSEVLLARLLSAEPASKPSCLVHGDFRLGNVMCAGGEVTGVVDWEIWSVTDPRIDLGWLLLFCDQTNFPGVSVIAPGMPSGAELLAEYATRTGSSVDGVDWFLAFACFKMAAIMGHNLRRHLEGQHHDPFQERLGPTIERLIERGQELVPR